MTSRQATAHSRARLVYNSRTIQAGGRCQGEVDVLPESELPQGVEHRPVPPDSLAVPVRVDVAGHDLTLFVESPPLFAAMLDDLRAAQQRIWLETYIILDDSVGQRIAEILKEKARAGLDVRLHYDAVGSLSTPYRFFRDLANAGVRVHAFHSFWEG